MAIPQTPSPLQIVVMAKTYNAQWFSGATPEAQITAAIAAAVNDGAPYVFVPANLQPYNASLVTFNTAVQMTREGGVAPGEGVDVKAYGAYGDNSHDDTAAFQAALAWSAANVEFFGTSLIACPPVIVPTVPSPSPQTKGYKITQPLALSMGQRLKGTGPFGAILVFTTTGSTLFTFFGTAEGQNAYIILENIYCFSNPGGAAANIGFRMRNFGFIQLRNCIFSNFDVGLWADWGQDVDCYETFFVLCNRGVQLGGNLTQTETPTPPAGIRHAPLSANPWFDNGSFFFCKFSQNVLDVNHMGSNTSHGNTLFLNCTFFESATGPVTGKTQFIHTTRLKGLNVQNCWFECGTNGRTAVQLDSNDFDGNAGGVNSGGVIANNHFLFTAAMGMICINIIRAVGLNVYANTFEFNTSGTTVAIQLSDATNTSYIGPNSWLSYPDIEFTGNLPISAISMIGVPPGGHNLQRIGPSQGAPTYSASITPRPDNEVLLITVTNNSAFTVQPPAYQRFGPLRFEIFNNSGGAMGAVTFSTGANGFSLTGGAFSAPANGKSRFIEFVWSSNRSLWIETWRSAADV